MVFTVRIHWPHNHWGCIDQTACRKENPATAFACLSRTLRGRKWRPSASVGDTHTSLTSILSMPLFMIIFQKLLVRDDSFWKVFTGWYDNWPLSYLQPWGGSDRKQDCDHNSEIFIKVIDEKQTSFDMTGAITCRKGQYTSTWIMTLHVRGEESKSVWICEDTAYYMCYIIIHGINKYLCQYITKWIVL